MTEQRRPLVDSQVPYRATWVPAARYQLVPTGEHFDAVRVAGRLAMDVADVLVEATEHNAGPIIREVHGQAWMYFLVPPGVACELSWPFGVQVLDVSRASQVGVPALWGNTWPLCWRSVPTATARLVSVSLLHDTICAQTRFRPLPIHRG